MEKFLITSALPYANGPLHFGHIAGVYLPSDIYTRHRKIQGHKVMHICGSDEHGVAIMLSAEKAGVSYQDWVDKWNAAHKELFAKYGITFDFFGRTSSEYHKEETLRWFNALNEKGYIGKKPEKQLYCEDCKKFLPDRYVEGQCYVCKYEPARGDECPNCGEWIDPLRLLKPRCKICSGSNITVKESEHWYLLLTKLEPKFKPWFATKTNWRPHVWEYVNSLLKEGLIDRAITRDLSWGIDVPLPEAKGKKLYVWFDAPIGYVSNTKEFLRQAGIKEDYLKDWWNDPKTKILHFIGKDNIIFHGLIWPCMILGSEITQPPTDVPANHFANLEGKQFSKSTGWYVDADATIEAFGEDAMRFYLTSLIPETGDSNFSWDGFESLNNTLANNIGNYINRSTSFLAKHWPDGLSSDAFTAAFASPKAREIQTLVTEVTKSFDAIQFQKALAAMMKLGEVANLTFHEEEPWKTIKTDRAKAEQTIALSVIFAAAINTVFRPVLPKFSSALAEYFAGYLDESTMNKVYCGDFGALQAVFRQGYRLPVAPKPLLPRVDPEKVKSFRLTDPGK